MSKRKVLKNIYLVTVTILMVFFFLYAFIKNIEVERERMLNRELYDKINVTIEEYDEEISTLKDSINILRNIN